MEPPPVIITVTDLRRSASRIIDSATESGAPIFVTQNGRATAVLVSRERYEGLVHRAMPGPEPEDAAGSRPGPAVISSRPAASRWGLVETRFGLTDPETAAFLAEEGFGPLTSTPAAGIQAAEGDSTPDQTGAPDVTGELPSDGCQSPGR